MSVILESQPGDLLVCIQEFNASPEGAPFAWATSRAFHIGDKVAFVGSEQNPHFKDRPNGWMVRFETTEGQRYQATQTYFVTEDAWARIENAAVANRQRQTSPLN